MLQTKKSLIDRTGTGLNKYIHAVASLYHRLHTADIRKLTLFHIYWEEGALLLVSTYGDSTVQLRTELGDYPQKLFDYMVKDCV